MVNPTPQMTLSKLLAYGGQGKPLPAILAPRRGHDERGERKMVERLIFEGRACVQDMLDLNMLGYTFDLNDGAVSLIHYPDEVDEHAKM